MKLGQATHYDGLSYVEIRYTGGAMCLAIPGKILEAAERGWNRVAKVQFGGVTREVFLDFVPEAGVGDYVLVHVGFAVSKVDEVEAKRTYEMLEQMGALTPTE